MTDHPCLHRLRGRHSLLEAALIEERRRPAPDPVRIAGIKKRKLRLKDQLEAMLRRDAVSA